MSFDPGQLWSSSEYAPTAARLAPVAEMIIDCLGAEVAAPAEVLEVGAGHGGLAATLANAGYHVAALEPSSRMRAVGSTRTPEQVNWIDATSEATGLDSESFDAVVSSFGLMFADPGAAVPEVARVLRPGGLLIMTAWAPKGFLHAMTRRMIKVLPHLADAPHLTWGEPETATQRLRSHFEGCPPSLGCCRGTSALSAKVWSSTGPAALPTPRPLHRPVNDAPSWSRSSNNNCARRPVWTGRSPRPRAI